MSERLRILNERGIEAFRDWFDAGAPVEATPYLFDDDHSVPHPFLPGSIRMTFEDKMDLGAYLADDLLGGVDPEVLTEDSSLWTTLSFIWFPLLRKELDSDVGEIARYFVADYDWGFSRNLVRMTWYAFRKHRENARFMLMTTKPEDRPLSIGGEVLEQFVQRVSLLGRKSVVEASARIFLDHSKGRPRIGLAGEQFGQVRRFTRHISQLNMVYDLAKMTADEIVSVISDEFKMSSADALRQRQLLSPGKKKKPAKASSKAGKNKTGQRSKAVNRNAKKAVLDLDQPSFLS